MRRAHLVGFVLLGAACIALGTLHRRAVAPGVVTRRHTSPAAPLALRGDGRVLVFAPHPDDETLALGGLLARLAHRGVSVHLVFVTNGDGYPQAVARRFGDRKLRGPDYVAFGELRQREALAATRRLGLRDDAVSFLGFPDGGLAELWRAHWSRQRPYTSPYTNENRPPYADSVSHAVDYAGQDLTAVITRVLTRFHPTVVVLPHPHDRHPDHAYTSYFVTEAVHQLEARAGLPPDLRMLHYLVHFPSWPATRGPRFDRCWPISEVADTSWLETELTAAELDAKRAALGEYRSQLGVMNGFLGKFLCRNELLATVDATLRARIAAEH